MRRATLIVNPFASRVDDETVGRVEAVLAAAWSLTTVATAAPGHAAELARDAAGEAVFVFSGDGGFNEVLNGARAGLALGFVPGGGTSVLPRALGLPRDPLAAAHRIAAGRTRTIGLGRVNGRRFGFAAGVGLDAELVRRVEALGRSPGGRRPGDLAFARAALALLAERRARLDPVLEIAGAGRAAFALVANCDPYTYVGRVALHPAPAARFELGLDLVAPRAVRPRSLPRLAAYAVSGRGQRSARDVVYVHDADRLELACDVPMALQADGEDLGDVSHALFEAERSAVSVFV